MKYLGDLPETRNLAFAFNTWKSDGTPITLAGSPVIEVYKGNSLVETTEGVVLTVDLDSMTGNHLVYITMSPALGFYVQSFDYSVVLVAGTVDGISVAGTVLAQFSIENRSKTDVSSLATSSAVSDLDAKLGTDESAGTIAYDAHYARQNASNAADYAYNAWQKGYDIQTDISNLDGKLGDDGTSGTIAYNAANAASSAETASSNAYYAWMKGYDIQSGISDLSDKLGTTSLSGTIAYNAYNANLNAASALSAASSAASSAGTASGNVSTILTRLGNPASFWYDSDISYASFADMINYAANNSLTGGRSASTAATNSATLLTRVGTPTGSLAAVLTNGTLVAGSLGATAKTDVYDKALDAGKAALNVAVPGSPVVNSVNDKISRLNFADDNDLKVTLDGEAVTGGGGGGGMDTETGEEIDSILENTGLILSSLQSTSGALRTYQLMPGYNSIEGVSIDVTRDLSRSDSISAPQISDAQGITGWDLPAGIYYVWRSKDGETFSNPDIWKIS